jgi:hypothetical protein
VEYRTRREVNLDDVYFTITWSPFSKADKYEIITRVPSVGGIAELYYMDEKGKLNLFCLQRSWYGGLRAMLRERCDPSIEKDPFRLSILVKWRDRIYYRWTNCDSHPDMNDIMYFLTQVNSPDAPGVEHSGRFKRIFLQEIDAGKLVTI